MLHSAWLTVSTSTLVVGTAIALAFPSSKPMVAVVASVMGAAGGAMLVQSKPASAQENLSQEILAKLAALEQSNQQVLSSLAALQQSKGRVPAAAFKPNRSVARPVPPRAELPVRVSHPTVRAESDPIAAWFQARNVVVHDYRVPSDKDRVLDNLALRLGQSYRYLKRFYQQIKKVSIDQGRKLTFDLSVISEAEREAIRAFCQSQFSNPYWDSRYVSELEHMEVMPIKSPILCNFLEGGWLESFVEQKVRQCLTRYQCEHIGRRGLKITLPYPLQNGQQDCELDLFFLIAGEPLWIECKVGSNYKQDVPRYVEQCSVMGIDKERSFLLLTDITPEDAISYTPLGGITLVSIYNLEERLVQVLQSQGLAESLPTPVPTVSKNRLSEILNHRSLRPSPEIRSRVLAELVNLFALPHVPLTMSQIKEQVLSRIPDLPGISAARVNEILRALLLQGSFRDEEGQTIAGYRSPVAALAGDAEVLEQKCFEAYATAILDNYPDYFENPEHQRNFQEVTGRAAPDPETLQRLLGHG